MITTDNDALTAFARLCPLDVCPELTTEEVYRILDGHNLGSVWLLSTAYQVGAVVVPTLGNLNGHRYRLIEFSDTGTDQKSGATEPDWPIVRESTVTDNHVIWREDGDDYGGDLWDIRGAAQEGWLLKAAKASPTSDWQAGEMSIKSSQLFDHCMKMSDRFQPVYVL